MSNFDLSNVVSTFLLPGDISNLKLPSPELVNFYKDLSNRTIWITDEIDTDVLAYARYIMGWNNEDKGIAVEDRKPIRIYIFSAGGEVIPTLTLVDTMKLSKTPIYTYNLGEAYSAAGLIFMAGHMRFVLPSSKVMIHRLASGTEGSMKQLEDNLKELKSIDEVLRGLILDFTKITPQKYKKQSNNDWFIPAKECLELGVADRVIEDIDEIF